MGGQNEKGPIVNEAAQGNFPQPAVQELAKILFDLVDGLRQATSLTDVNVAAGIAWNALLGLELIELAAHGPDELGQIFNLLP